MKFLLAAVGRAKPGQERSLLEHYAARIKWPLAIKEVEAKRPLPSVERRAREAALLLGVVPAGAVVIALDERGKNLTSADLARKLGQWRDEGRADVAFLIGGADGHGPGVKERADLVLSLGAMTWPHMLVRALLAEQLFRAQCILEGHPYHRE